MAELSLFDQLVATEAAARLESVHRRHIVTLTENGRQNIYAVSNPDKGGSQEEVAKNLTDTFLHVYDFAFQDSSQHHKVVGGKVCSTRDLKAADREKLREIIGDFTKKLYDGNGEFRTSLRDRPQEVSEAMQDLYKQLGEQVPLHNSGLVRGALFVEISRGDKWKKAFSDTPGLSRGIDFTRGEPTQDLAQRFRDAFNGPDHSPSSSEYWKPPESLVEIGGVRFFAKADVGGWRKHLVTQTGHLVDLTDELRHKIEKHLRDGKPLGELTVDVNNAPHLREFQQDGIPGNGDFARMKSFVEGKLKNLAEADTIDGIKVRDDSGRYLPARFMSPDLDLLTGLRITPAQGDKESELTRLKNAMKQKNFADLVPDTFAANVLALPTENARSEKREELRRHVHDEMVALEKTALDKKDGHGAPTPDFALADIIKRAGTNLEAMIPRIYESADKAFLSPGEEAKSGAKMRKVPPTSHPHMYMTMGGAASGKSGLKSIAEKECRNTLVVATLDDARGQSDRYWLYPATNNHNDDYKASEQFGNAVRDLVTKRALKGKYNLYIDGSGIPYDNRNDITVRTFKDNGYDVSVLATQAPLFIYDPKRREELFQQGSAPDDALLRSGTRLSKDLRGLNPEIIADKHIGFALASRNAARDPNVDRFMIMDSTPARDNAYTLSYVVTLKQSDLDGIVNLTGEKLKEAVASGGERLRPKWVTLPRNNEDMYNLKVIRDNGNGTYRAEIITDIEQYIGMVQKGILRRDAKGPEALYDNRVHSDVEGYFMGENGRLNIKNAKWAVTAQWPQYTSLSSAQHANGRS